MRNKDIVLVKTYNSSSSQSEEDIKEDIKYISLVGEKPIVGSVFLQNPSVLESVAVGGGAASTQLAA